MAATALNLTSKTNVNIAKVSNFLRKVNLRSIFLLMNSYCIICFLWESNWETP
jgi:hypothetical protein